jgi:glycosyltransferase involved in cell wall biosynthesis
MEIDVDFLESLKLYLDHFESFAIACPVRTTDIKGSGLERCVPVADLPWGADRLKLIPLPTTYKPIEFARRLPAVRRILRSEIKNSEYLIFTPYSLIGDWPTLAIREAIKLQRPYVIEADGVHADIMRMRSNSGAAWKQFVKKNVLIPFFERAHRYCLSHSALGVFQGQDVYNAYAPFCRNPHKLNHHISVYAGDHITAAQLQAKLDSLDKGSPIKICYAGRAIDMKGPLDWVETLHLLNTRGVKFQATWLGDGPMLEEMRNKVVALGISDQVTFSGFVSDRETILSALKEAHIFLFCHTTLESARVLGEALACGCPLIGYWSAYPFDLVEAHGGGLLTKIGDRIALAQNVQDLTNDRDKLRSLIRQAARSGQGFDRTAALLKRIDLVRQQKRPNHPL